MHMTVCNYCGKTFDDWDKQQNAKIHIPKIQYGSLFDGMELNLYLCCDCMDRIIESCVISPTE